MPRRSSIGAWHWMHTDTMAGYTEYVDGEWGVAPDTFPGGEPDDRNPMEVLFEPGL